MPTKKVLTYTENDEEGIAFAISIALVSWAVKRLRSVIGLPKED